MEINLNRDLPASDELFELFQTTGWNEDYMLSPEELLEAAANSSYTISAYWGTELAGFTRIVSDGVVHAMIFDMIVKPEMQNLGIGTLLLKEAISYCSQKKIRDIQLFSAPGKEGFYRKNGFKLRPVDAPGMEIKRSDNKRS